MKNIFISIKVLLVIPVLFFANTSYSQDTIYGDKVGGDKVQGNKIINQVLDAPNFTIDVSERSIMSGGTVQLSLHSDRPKYLIGAKCSWRAIPQKGMEFSLNTSGCNATMTSRIVNFRKESMSGYHAITAKIIVDIHKGGEHFETKGEFFVIPDLNSPEFLAQQQESIKELMNGQLESIQSSMGGIKIQAESFRTLMERKSFLDDLSKNMDELIECIGGSCELELEKFCESGVNTIKWNEQGIVTNISQFCHANNESSRRKFCLTPDLGLPKLIPGKRYATTVTFGDGHASNATIEISSRHNGFDSTSIEWTSLLPSSSNTPYAAVRFSENNSELVVYLASGNCDYEKVQYGYDTDGKGFIDLSRPQSAGDTFKIRYPKINQIQIRYQKNGQTFGPYTYLFDSDKFLAYVARYSNSMKLKCQSDRKTGKVLCGLPKRSSPLLWSGVSEIAYGSSSSSLLSYYKINIDNKILRSSLRGKNTSLNYTFEVSEDWEDIFYILKMKDGSKSKVIRIPL